MDTAWISKPGFEGHEGYLKQYAARKGVIHDKWMRRAREYTHYDDVTQGKRHGAREVIQVFACVHEHHGLSMYHTEIEMGPTAKGRSTAGPDLHISDETEHGNR